MISMNQMNNDDFIEFIESFCDEYFFSVTEISRAKTRFKQPLIESKFKMFSFDDMCKRYDIIRENRPKTMDAIHFEIDENGKLRLYLIEFKNFSMEGSKSTYTQIKAMHRVLEKKNNQYIDRYSKKKVISNNFLKKFQDIEKHFVDSIEFDLRMKPEESILISLPWLYEEYCKDKQIEQKDFRKYLNSIDVHIIVFINRYSTRQNISANRLSAHAIDNALKQQYSRLYLSGVIADDSERIFSSDRFDYFIKKEGLTQYTCRQ